MSDSEHKSYVCSLLGNTKAQNSLKTNPQFHELKYKTSANAHSQYPIDWIQTLLTTYIQNFKRQHAPFLSKPLHTLPDHDAQKKEYFDTMPFASQTIFTSTASLHKDNTMIVAKCNYCFHAKMLAEYAQDGTLENAFSKMSFESTYVDMCTDLDIIQQLWDVVFFTTDTQKEKNFKSFQTHPLSNQVQQQLALHLTRIYRARFFIQSEASCKKEIEILVNYLFDDFQPLFHELSHKSQRIMQAKAAPMQTYMWKMLQPTIPAALAFAPYILFHILHRQHQEDTHLQLEWGDGVLAALIGFRKYVLTNRTYRLKLKHITDNLIFVTDTALFTFFLDHRHNLYHDNHNNSHSAIPQSHHVLLPLMYAAMHFLFYAISFITSREKKAQLASVENILISTSIPSTTWQRLSLLFHLHCPHKTR